jgi:predicted transporter
MCAAEDIVDFKWSIMTRFIVDSVLLGFMIVGVLQGRSPTKLWNMLWFQGLFWIIAAILIEVPDVVCHSGPRGCVVRRVGSSSFTTQVMPFLNINGEQIWMDLETCYLLSNRVNRRLESG